MIRGKSSPKTIHKLRAVHYISSSEFNDNEVSDKHIEVSCASSAMEEQCYSVEEENEQEEQNKNVDEKDNKNEESAYEDEEAQDSCSTITGTFIPIVLNF